MKTSPSPDRETFQQVLSNAFAEQESPINPESLSAAMDLHLDGAMRHIVESVQRVANAAGVGIALLKRDRLTYRAGIGSCANCVGLQVAASLTVSAGAKTNREILRVENAQTDTRIEADICRQFGANALLILPIYQNGTVAGVLDVRFNEAHTFDDHEVQAYRSMAEQVEVALTRAAQLEHQANQNETVAAALQPILEELPIPALAQVATPKCEQVATPHLAEAPQELEQIAPVEFDQTAPLEEDSVAPPAFMMLPQNEHSLYARCQAVLADIKEMAVFKQTAWLATTLAQQAKKLSSPSPQPASSEVATRKLPIFKRPTLPAALRAQRARILTWPERGRNSAQAAASELSSVFKRTASSATVLAQRAKNATWPKRLRGIAQAAIQELSTVLRQSVSRALALTQQTKNVRVPNRWRNSAQAAATEFSLVLRRTASSAATLPQRAQNLTSPNRCRNFARAMAAEFSAILKRAGSSATMLAKRAQNLRLPGSWRNTAVTGVAVVLAFIAGVAYKSHGPAKSLESSTLPSASSTDQPAPVTKPLPGKATAAIKPASVLPNAASSAKNTLKRVRVGSKEVEYIGDDVTVRTFTNRSPAKRTRVVAGRTANIGDDVTVRYFTPSSSVTKTAAR
jgi:putative methionine-R-sulfoxide reductase with GAF domain